MLWVGHTHPHPVLYACMYGIHRRMLTHCVLRVKAALVIEAGRSRAFATSLQAFLLITYNGACEKVSDWNLSP